MPDQTWSHGEYMLWLNNEPGSYFGAHSIVRDMLDQDDEAIGHAILSAYPAHDFSTSIDPDQIDAAEVGRELREDHLEWGY